MKIAGGNSVFNVAVASLADLSDSKNANRKALVAQAAQNKAALDQASRELADALSNTRNGYETAMENVDLSLIWQRARDWGLGEQTDMALYARDVAVRSANEATLTDSQREVMDKEISAMAAETTRIGVTNNISGSHTLARREEVQEITEVEKVVEVEEEKVTETKPQIDVLWVVDRTGSMGDKVSQIQRDAQKMFNALEEKGFDVRMAVESYERNLDSNGSTDFRSDSATFAADVRRVLDGIDGGLENGLTGLDQAMARFGDKFNQEATKVTVLLSDDYVDDFGAGFDGDINQNAELQPGEKPEIFRQKVADALKSAGSELFVVGGGGVLYTYNPITSGWELNPDETADKDYLDVISKVGEGGTVKLDSGGKWVDEVTKNFIASVEKDIGKETTQEVVTEKIITTRSVILDDWDLTFQVGPGADEHIVENFKTSTAETSGLSKADATTAEKARNAIDTIDHALEFLGENRSQVGGLESRFTAINNDLHNRALTPQKQVSALTDAFNPQVGNSLWGLLSIHLKLG